MIQDDWTLLNAITDQQELKELLTLGVFERIYLASENLIKLPVARQGKHAMGTLGFGGAVMGDRLDVSKHLQLEPLAVGEGMEVGVEVHVNVGRRECHDTGYTDIDGMVGLEGGGIKVYK
jgi:hypothetical protein